MTNISDMDRATLELNYRLALQDNAALVRQCEVLSESMEKAYREVRAFKTAVSELRQALDIFSHGRPLA